MISIEVDGVVVEGEITHRSEHDIVVEYQGLRTGMHIPAFATYPKERCYTGPHGDKTAADLLKELYQLRTYIDKNKEVLKTNIAKMDANIEALDPEQFFTKEKFQETRIELRKQLRAGLDKKEYQRLHVQARKKMEARNSEIWKIKDVFFQSNFPMIVPLCSRNGVLVLEMLRN